jgi:hypothetical protein
VSPQYKPGSFHNRLVMGQNLHFSKTLIPVTGFDGAVNSLDRLATDKTIFHFPCHQLWQGGHLERAS